jgi:site-specific DNA recombinase
MKNLRYFIYARKSSEGDERQALSIPSQKDEALKLFGNLEVVEVIEEKHSAFTPHNRPAFTRMIERIRNGEAQGIIAWHPDRLSRNEVDAAILTYMLRTGELLDLKFGSYSFDNSPEGIMMLQFALSQSQYSSAKLSKDVKRGLEKKRSMGWQPGVAPSGYRNTPDLEKGTRVLLEDPERFPLVRKMWDLMLTGLYSPERIVNTANKEWGYTTPSKKKSGGKPMARSSIYTLFTNPFYYGVFESPRGSGVWHKGSHRPMITEEEFNRVQVLLGRKGRPRAKTRESAFTGLISCGECGCSITADPKNQLICSECKYKFSYENRTSCPKCSVGIDRMKNPTILHYIYYHCTKKRGSCSQRGLEVKVLEKQINSFLETIEIDQKYVGWAIKHLKKAHTLESSTRETITDSQQTAYNAICKKLDQLLELRMNDEVSEEEYKGKKSKLMKEKEHLQELLKATDARQESWLELTEKTFAFAHYSRYWFTKGDLKKKREIFSTLGSNMTLKDKKILIQAEKPFSIIQSGLTELGAEKASLEPTMQGSTKRKEAAFAAPNPILLRRQDSNL